jgi:S-DNA-T family DNA segregation ATPase FtsK/SpoIIIE
MEKPVNTIEVEEKKKQLKREIWLILLITFTLFLVLMLATFSSHDPSLFTQQVFPAEKTNNFFGKFGSHIAAILIQILGITAYVIPLYLVVILVYSRFLKSFNITFARIFFFFTALLSLAAFLSAIVPDQSLFGIHIPLGGFIGLVFADIAARYFNPSGSIFISVTLFVIFSILALEKNIFKKIIQIVLNFIQSLPKILIFKEKSIKTETRPPKIIKPMQQKEPVISEETVERESPPKTKPGVPTLPPISLLNISREKYSGPSEAELNENGDIIETCLRNFDINGKISEVHPGPVITMYEFIPEPGTKINRIISLEHELSMALKAISLRIVAPIPGKSSIGIEVSNKKIAVVCIRELIGSEDFSEKNLKIPLALGKDTAGMPYITDLAKMPHLLVAGSTGSGKSVSINAMILSILYKMMPDEAKFIMIDPKMLELNLYRDIPHLAYPVVTNPEEAAKVLKWAIREMERRYELMAESSVRNIDQYNSKVADIKQKGLFDDGEPREKLPYVIIIIDELSDLMMVAPKEVETYITRLAQKARAAGIHMVVATQRPSVDVITGLIKANFPARIAFKVASKTDSRTILDANGADSLLGHGDMLFLRPSTSLLSRLHGALVTEEEIQSVVAFWKKQFSPQYIEISDEPEESGGENNGFEDDKYEEAVRIVKESRQASISHLQRRLRIGYNRAARMIERMESEGIVSPPDGSRPREVLF